jgi:hypothetical protein
MSFDHGRLSGWKEIAGFLGRGVRTVQRWEREYDLPIRRPGPEGALIFAYRAELEDWVRAGINRRTTAASPEPLTVVVTAALPAGAAPSPIPAPSAPTHEADIRSSVGAHCLIWEGRPFSLREGSTVLGRADEADAQILLPSVSRRHARIVVRGTEARLEDLESRHGTWRGATRVHRPTPLSSGDEIRLGSALLIYRFVRPTDTTI